VTRVLLTGFDPFDYASMNPSWEAVRLVAAAPPDGVALITALLPCVFGNALDELRLAVARTEPDLVICTGQAGGRTEVSVERIAVNVDDARIPDNDGNLPFAARVVPGGPAAYFATLPVKACVAAVWAAGLPAAVSQTAGTFVCNHVFYGLMHLIATELPHVRGGFVHVPYAPEQVLTGGEPCLPIPSVAQALRIIAATAATVGVDRRLAAGAIH